MVVYAQPCSPKSIKINCTYVTIETAQGIVVLPAVTSCHLSAQIRDIINKDSGFYFTTWLDALSASIQDAISGRDETEKIIADYIILIDDEREKNENN